MASLRFDREVGFRFLTQVGHQVFEELEGRLTFGLWYLMRSAFENHEEDASILLLETCMLVACKPRLAE